MLPTTMAVHAARPRLACVARTGTAAGVAATTTSGSIGDSRLGRRDRRAGLAGDDPAQVGQRADRRALARGRGEPAGGAPLPPHLPRGDAHRPDPAPRPPP